MILDVEGVSDAYAPGKEVPVVNWYFFQPFTKRKGYISLFTFKEKNFILIYDKLLIIFILYYSAIKIIK